MRNAKQSGLTLIELMVAIAILAMIVLIVSGLMVQMTELVRSSQDMIRCNAKARAVADVLRDDLLTMSKQGLLAIVASPQVNPPDRHIARNDNGPPWPAGDNLLLTMAMPDAHTTLPPDQVSGAPPASNEALINYGVAAAWSYPPADNTKVLSGFNILYRNTVPTGVDLPWNATGGYFDYYGFSQSLLNMRGRLSAERLLMRELINAGYNFWYPGMSVPPGTPNGRDYYGDWYKLMMPTGSPWAGVFGDMPILGENCTGLAISWTDGDHDAAGNLKWYSARYPKNNAWTGRDWRYQRATPQEDAPECSLAEPSTPQQGPSGQYTTYNPAGTAYCALWTGEKLNNWPLAIKVRYTLKEGRDNTPGFSEVFEAVVDLK